MKILDFRTRPRTEFFFKDIVPKPIPAFEYYFSIYHMESRLNLGPLSETVDEMNEHGITRGVIFAGSFAGLDHVVEACAAYPDKFVGMIGIDVGAGVSEGVKNLEYAYREKNILGLTLSPFMNGIYANDPRYYPLFALSEQMGKPVQIHSSVHFNTYRPLDLGDPNRLDKIAVDFPKLKLVIGHAGMGFGSLGVTVAMRHPNVFIDFTGLRPQYIPADIMAAANGILKKKAIFGTNYPTLGYDLAEEWKKFIREENQAGFFYDNAANVLGLKD